MATLVLVHPAWFGGWCWRDVVRPLRAAGHDAWAPTLTGFGERAHLATPAITLGTHVDDVINMLEVEDLHDVTLVGSSSGGTVITAVADRCPERIARLVYLDAFVPSDGQSTLDLLPPDRAAALDRLVQTEGDGWRLPRFGQPPWAVILREIWHVTDDDKVRWVLPRLRSAPFAHFTEPVRLTNARATAGIKRVYIRCVNSAPSPFDRAAAAAQASSEWEYRAMQTYHIPLITNPQEVAQAMLEIVA
jgi:pimeloyl-ACP methyl ester carboxylesterase